MKQTAVEWLEEQLLELFENHLPFELLEKAKEMEKEQIIDAVNENWLVDIDQHESGNDYLKRKYGK